MNGTSNEADLARIINLDIDGSDPVVVVDETEAAFKPVPHGLILRTSPGPVYVMGDDGKWHRHTTVRC